MKRRILFWLSSWSDWFAIVSAEFGAEALVRAGGHGPIALLATLPKAGRSQREAMKVMVNLAFQGQCW